MVIHAHIFKGSVKPLLEVPLLFSFVSYHEDSVASMANERASHGVQEEDVVDEAAVVALSSLPARHIDALDVKVTPLGIFLGWEKIPS